MATQTPDASTADSTQATPTSHTYSSLNKWLAEPAQKERLANQQVEDGPLIPPVESSMVANREMYQNIATAFTRGCQSALDNTITGPEIPTDMTSDNGIQMLWNYYNHGFAAAARKRFTQGSQARSSTVKLPDPPKFTGDRHKLEEFIKKLHVKFNMEQERFPLDVHKISYASSFLVEEAGIWFSPHVDKDTGKIAFQTYSDFLTALRKSYGDPNRVATAEREVMKLKQTSTIDLYYSKFKEYMDILNWSEGQKIHHFRLGLREKVKDALVFRNQYAKATDFEEFYTNAREAENDLNIRAQEGQTATDPNFRKNAFRSERRYNQFLKPRSTASGTHSGPMDLSAAPRRTPSSNKQYTGLTKEEKEQRFKKGQCFYCKETGHYVSDCPKAKKGAPATQGNWRKPGNRKALVATREEQEKVVFSLGGAKEESKN